ncbi:hypothetical protein [Parapedobacter indicus]|nr:hypothetical protein [Parapedobacter indicus]
MRKTVLEFVVEIVSDLVGPRTSVGQNRAALMIALAVGCDFLMS